MPKKQVRWSKSLLKSLGGVDNEDEIIIPKIELPKPKKLSASMLSPLKGFQMITPEQKMKAEEEERKRVEEEKIQKRRAQQELEEHQAELKRQRLESPQLSLPPSISSNIETSFPSKSITSQLSLPPSISSYMQPANTTSFIEYEIGPRKYELEKWKITQRKEAKKNKDKGGRIYNGPFNLKESIEKVQKSKLSPYEKNEVIKEYIDDHSKGIYRFYDPSFDNPYGTGIKYRKNKYMP